MPDSSGLPVAGVFRLHLFKPSETFIVEQARLLRGFVPHLIGRDIAGPAPVGIPVHLPSGGGRFAEWSRKILGAEDFFCGVLKDAGCKVAHAHFGVDAVSLLAPTKALDLPLITTFHGYDATTHVGRLFRSGSPTLIRYAFRRSTLATQGRMFICVSEFIREKVLELGFPENRVVKHYIGTDIGRFSAVESPIGDRSPTILHVARLVEKKGTVDLLHAFASVRKSVADAKLVIIGDGPLRPMLQQCAAELQLGGSVLFAGVQAHAEVIGWLKRSTVFCLPSVTAQNGDTEGLPISIIEAAAAGLPTVATWHSGIPEAIEDGKGGILVKERDRPALADALRQILLNSTLATQLGGQARRHIQLNFDLKAQSAKLGDLYAAACH